MTDVAVAPCNGCESMVVGQHDTFGMVPLARTYRIHRLLIWEFMPFWFSKRAVSHSKTACFRIQNGTFYNVMSNRQCLSDLRKVFSWPGIAAYSGLETTRVRDNACKGEGLEKC